MGKYKAVKKKSDAPAPQMKPGVPCLVIIVAGMIVTMILMILVMRQQ
jgi:hypothetical protein